jgi:hypothetical protein
MRALLLATALTLGPLLGWATHHEPPPRCTEDMSCWDCTTMGNGVCGPQPVDDPRVEGLAA